MKTPYYIKHRQELKPRELVKLTEAEKEAKLQELGHDLILIPVTEPFLKLLRTVGNNDLDVEIQSAQDVPE